MRDLYRTGLGILEMLEQSLLRFQAPERPNVRYQERHPELRPRENRSESEFPVLHRDSTAVRVVRHLRGRVLNHLRAEIVDRLKADAPPAQVLPPPPHRS